MNNVIPALRRHRYAVLLVLALVTLAIQSFDVLPGAEGARSDTLRTLLGVAILVVVFDRFVERLTMGILLIAMILLGWWPHFAHEIPGPLLSLAHPALMALYLWVAVGVILRDLFRAPAVGAENVLGAICGYVIAGDAWAGINGLVYLLAPGAYSVGPEVAPLIADWHGRQALFSYYSFAQMMTIGYSDVTPIRAPATTLSLFAALFGIFYTAVVVSQFVGFAQSNKGKIP